MYNHTKKGKGKKKQHWHFRRIKSWTCCKHNYPYNKDLLDGQTALQFLLPIQLTSRAVLIIILLQQALQYSMLLLIHLILPDTNSRACLYFFLISNTRVYMQCNLTVPLHQCIRRIIFLFFIYFFCARANNSGYPAISCGHL